MLRVKFLTFTLRVLVILVSTGTLVQHGASTASAQASPNAVKIQFSAAAELQNEGLFELAVGEWRAFLEKFPNDPLAAKARHYLGVCLIQEKQYPDAAAELSKIVTQHPKFELLDETLLNLGSAQYQIAVVADAPQRYAEPAATYGKLLTQFPDSKLVPTALYNQGECYYAMGQREKAAAAYDTFLKKFADHKLRSDAIYALGVTQLELKQAAAAQATLDQFLKSFPDHQQSTQVKMYKADALFEQEKFKEAAKLYTEVAATDGFELADRCVMRQADCLTSLKQYPQAADLFATIPQNFPKSAHVPAATLAAGSRYHLAGNHQQAIAWLSKSTGEPAVEAAHWLARAYLSQKKPAEALA
ncbi:MAG: tetratricopeptide repeat protein, partial [Planctomycetota bacterium]|nr:tetratricopeptide repeat protein [Planctomycetota bacterium]